MTESDLSRRAAISAIGAVAAMAGGASADAQDADDSMKSYALDDLKKQLGERGRPYHQFLDEPTLSAGIYRLPKGATDNQSPHELDEVYYVIEGRATFEAEGKTIEVRPGGVIFVKAKAEHRFRDIEQDLVLLVLFSKKRPDES